MFNITMTKVCIAIENIQEFQSLQIISKLDKVSNIQGKSDILKHPTLARFNRSCSHLQQMITGLLIMMAVALVYAANRPL